MLIPKFYYQIYLIIFRCIICMGKLRKLGKSKYDITNYKYLKYRNIHNKINEIHKLNTMINLFKNLIANHFCSYFYEHRKTYAELFKH